MLPAAGARCQVPGPDNVCIVWCGHTAGQGCCQHKCWHDSKSRSLLRSERGSSAHCPGAGDASNCVPRASARHQALPGGLAGWLFAAASASHADAEGNHAQHSGKCLCRNSLSVPHRPQLNAAGDREQGTAAPIQGGSCAPARPQSRGSCPPGCWHQVTQNWCPAKCTWCDPHIEDHLKRAAAA